MLEQLPGPWRTYAGGVSVRCQRDRRREPRGTPDRREGPRCGLTVVRVGRRKVMHVRIVGTATQPMSPAIMGDTIKCRCETVYEIDSRLLSDAVSKPSEGLACS